MVSLTVSYPLPTQMKSDNDDLLAVTICSLPLSQTPIIQDKNIAFEPCKMQFCQ